MEVENRLTKEQIFFLNTLSDYVNGRKTAVPSNLDVSQLVRLSNAQQLSPIVCYQTKLPELQQSYAMGPYYAVNRKKLLERINEKFREAGVRYLIFKGSEVAQFYRHPQLRLLGDMDILVHLSDKETAGNVLTELGFTAQENKGTEHEWVYKKGDFEIELHHRLLYDDHLNNADLTAFTDTVWEHVTTEDGVCCHMEPEFHFVYLLLHLRKHFLWAGVGIRQFVDLAMMMRNAEPDYRKIKKYIDVCGIAEFAGVCFAFVERWFVIRCSNGAAEISDEFYYASTEKILTGGAFGDMSRKRLVDNAVIQEVHEQGKLISALRIVFPDWEQMKKKYPQMGKWKILLPFLWVRRIIESLFRRTAKDGITYTGRHLTIGKQEKERNEVLETWGLY